MSNHEDLTQSPIQYPGSNEVQWIHNPDTNHVVLQDDSLQQWNEFTQPEMVTSVTSSTGSHPVFTHTNGISSISGFESFMNTSNGSINGLVLPNGARIGNGNLLPNRGNVPLAFRPRPPNGNASVNHWPSPDQNAGRLIRPNWNGVKTGGVRKPKRIRTAFTSSQMMELEQEYTRTRYLDRTRRIELAEYLHLNERTIKIWFQNRRMKEKKDKAESFEEEEATSTTDSASDLGMPVVVSDMPIEGVYHRGGVYLHDQYPVSSMSSQMPPPMQAGPSSMMNGYQAFAQEHYDSHRDVQTIPHHHTPYTGEVLETLDESRSQTEALNAPGNVLEQSWDVSWIQSIHITDDC